jgi:hypothetical protein
MAPAADPNRIWRGAASGGLGVHFMVSADLGIPSSEAICSAFE